MYKQQPIGATFHRPENVDNKDNLQRVTEVLTSFASKHPLIFPVHPRTQAKLRESGLWEKLQGQQQLLITEPLSYFEFLKLVSNAGLVITDSGGVQEETSFLNIPCVTFRKNTERPVTIEMGTNMLMSIHESNFLEIITKHQQHIEKRNAVEIPLWDENVSKRIVNFIKSTFN